MKLTNFDMDEVKHILSFLLLNKFSYEGMPLNASTLRL